MKSLKDSRDKAIRFLAGQLEGEMDPAFWADVAKVLRDQQQAAIALGIAYALTDRGLGDRGIQTFVAMHSPVLERILDGDVAPNGGRLDG